MTNTYFKTKEQYIQFRKAFATATKAGELNAEHFIFLNIVRGLPYHRGFTPVTKPSKLSNAHNIWGGLDHGMNRLRWVAHVANDLKQYPKNKPGAFGRFIEPLMIDGDEAFTTILMEILGSLEPMATEHKIYYSYFGEGRKIAELMIAEDLKPKNYQEFIEIIEGMKNAQ